MYHTSWCTAPHSSGDTAIELSHTAANLIPFTELLPDYRRRHTLQAYVVSWTHNRSLLQ